MKLFFASLVSMTVLGGCSGAHSGDLVEPEPQDEETSVPMPASDSGARSTDGDLARHDAGSDVDTKDVTNDAQETDVVVAPDSGSTLDANPDAGLPDIYEPCQSTMQCRSPYVCYGGLGGNNGARCTVPCNTGTDCPSPGKCNPQGLCVL